MVSTALVRQVLLIFARRLHQQINVLRGPREAVVDDGKAADHEVKGSRVVETAAERHELPNFGFLSFFLRLRNKRLLTCSFKLLSKF